MNGVIVKSSRARFDVDVASVDEVPVAITDDSLFTMQKIDFERRSRPCCVPALVVGNINLLDFRK